MDTTRHTTQRSTRGGAGDGQAEGPPELERLEPMQRRPRDLFGEGPDVQASRCARCGRPLTDPESIARGMGPVCAEKAGGSR